MMLNGRNRFSLTFLAAFLPVAASAASSITFQYTAYTTSAGSSGTVTLTSGQSLNLETGAAVSSGGDLAWNGSTLTPVGSAVAADLAALSSAYSGSSGYGLVTQTLLQAGLAAGLGSSKAFTPAQNDVIGLKDNSGNVGKLLVTTLTGGGTGTGGSPTPTITEVQNNYSYITPGQPNYGIAPGALFIIKGTNLANTTTVSALESSAGAGIPTSLNGASISVTVNGTTVSPGMYYAIASQIAAVLPSNTPTGTGTITVTSGGATSNSFAIAVVPTALGLDTYYGTGTGLGTATDAITGTLISYTNSATPGETLVLWGSGLGADTADSNVAFTSTPHAVSTPLTLYVGGIAVTPSYQGSSGYPGLNQINFTVPANVPTGCGVTVVGLSGSIVTNAIQLPIEAGGGVCSDSTLGYNGTQLSGGTTATSGTYTSAAVSLTQTTSPGSAPIGGEQTNGGAYFAKISGTTTTTGGSGSVISLGNCSITSGQGASGTTTSNTTTTGLNAGTITITGPSGSQTIPEYSSSVTGTLVGTYEATLPNTFIPANGGTFTASGSGGSDVGSFTASGSIGPFSWTNQTADATVTRANGVPITWTGGTSGTYVYIEGTSVATSSTGSVTGAFFCLANASAGSFTVPNYVALALPAGTGSLSIGNYSNPATFSASGLTSPGYFVIELTVGIQTTWQ